MDRFYLSHLSNVQTDQVLATLTRQQHLHPHRSLRDAIDAAGEAVGFCPSAAQAAMERMALDPHLAIGRLRRGELVELAQSLHRHWQQALELSSVSAGL